jgi:hypothetical protein
MDITQDSRTPSTRIFSQVSWQMNFFCILIIIAGTLCVYFAIETKLYLLLIYAFMFVFGFLFFRSYSISFDSNTIQVKSLLLKKIRFYEEITSITIFASSGRFLILGVPGFAITLGNEKFSRIVNILFVGRKYPHELTKLFINAAIAKNSSITISNSIVKAYGEPPYLVDENKLAKILNIQDFM